MNGARIIIFLCLMPALQGCAGPRDAEIAPSSSTSQQPAQAGLLTPQSETTLYFNVVEGLVKQQRYGAALAFLNDFSARRGVLTSRYWLLRGDVLQGLGSMADALAAYRKLETTDLAAQGWNGRGRVAAAGQHWAEAVDGFAKAVDGAPSNPDFLNNLAFAELHMGAPGRSAIHLRQAHELAPGSDRIRNNLIIALTINGDKAAANAVLEAIPEGARRDQAKAAVQSAVQSANLQREKNS